MELKSKFNEGDLVFINHPIGVCAYVIISISTYSQNDGFCYKCLSIDRLKRYVDENISIDRVESKEFDFFREEYLYKDNYDYLFKQIEIANKIENKKHEIKQLDLSYNFRVFTKRIPRQTNPIV